MSPMHEKFQPFSSDVTLTPPPTENPLEIKFQHTINKADSWFGRTEIELQGATETQVFADYSFKMIEVELQKHYTSTIIDQLKAARNVRLKEIRDKGLFDETDISSIRSTLTGSSWENYWENITQKAISLEKVFESRLDQKGIANKDRYVGIIESAVRGIAIQTRIEGLQNISTDAQAQKAGFDSKADIAIAISLLIDRAQKEVFASIPGAKYSELINQPSPEIIHMAKEIAHQHRLIEEREIVFPAQDALDKALTFKAWSDTENAMRQSDFALIMDAKRLFFNSVLPEIRAIAEQFNLRNVFSAAVDLFEDLVQHRWGSFDKSNILARPTQETFYTLFSDKNRGIRIAAKYYCLLLGFELTPPDKKTINPSQYYREKGSSALKRDINIEIILPSAKGTKLEGKKIYDINQIDQLEILRGLIQKEIESRTGMPSDMAKRYEHIAEAMLTHSRIFEWSFVPGSWKAKDFFTPLVEVYGAAAYWPADWAIRSSYKKGSRGGSFFSAEILHNRLDFSIRNASGTYNSLSRRMKDYFPPDANELKAVPYMLSDKLMSPDIQEVLDTSENKTDGLMPQEGKAMLDFILEDKPLTEPEPNKPGNLSASSGLFTDPGEQFAAQVLMANRLFGNTEGGRDVTGRAITSLITNEPWIQYIRDDVRQIVKAFNLWEKPDVIKHIFRSIVCSRLYFLGNDTISLSKTQAILLAEALTNLEIKDEKGNSIVVSDQTFLESIENKGQNVVGYQSSQLERIYKNLQVSQKKGSLEDSDIVKGIIDIGWGNKSKGETLITIWLKSKNIHDKKADQINL